MNSSLIYQDAYKIDFLIKILQDAILNAMIVNIEMRKVKNPQKSKITYLK